MGSVSSKQNNKADKYYDNNPLHHELCLQWGDNLPKLNNIQSPHALLIELQRLKCMKSLPNELLDIIIQYAVLIYNIIPTGGNEPFLIQCNAYRNLSKLEKGTRHMALRHYGYIIDYTNQNKNDQSKDHNNNNDTDNHNDSNNLNDSNNHCSNAGNANIIDSKVEYFEDLCSIIPDRVIHAMEWYIDIRNQIYEYRLAIVYNYNDGNTNNATVIQYHFPLSLAMKTKLIQTKSINFHRKQLTHNLLAIMMESNLALFYTGSSEGLNDGGNVSKNNTTNPVIMSRYPLLVYDFGSFVNGTEYTQARRYLFALPNNNIVFIISREGDDNCDYNYDFIHFYILNLKSKQIELFYHVKGCSIAQQPILINKNNNTTDNKDRDVLEKFQLLSVVGISQNGPKDNKSEIYCIIDWLYYYTKHTSIVQQYVANQLSNVSNTIVLPDPYKIPIIDCGKSFHIYNKDKHSLLLTKLHNVENNHNNSNNINSTTGYYCIYKLDCLPSYYPVHAQIYNNTHQLVNTLDFQARKPHMIKFIHSKLLVVEDIDITFGRYYQPPLHTYKFIDPSIPQGKVIQIIERRLHKKSDVYPLVYCKLGTSLLINNSAYSCYYDNLNNIFDDIECDNNATRLYDSLHTFNFGKKDPSKMKLSGFGSSMATMF